MGAQAPQPVRAALLRHDLPDGSSHIDFFLGPRIQGLDPQREPDAKCLIGFRLARRPDEVDCGLEVPAQRMPDHRAHYLNYEGPLTGDRGQVTQLRAGIVRGEIDSLDRTGSLDVSIDWLAGDDRPAIRQRLRLQRLNGDEWRLKCVAMQNESVAATP